MTPPLNDRQRVFWNWTEKQRVARLSFLTDLEVLSILFDGDIDPEGDVTWDAGPLVVNRVDVRCKCGEHETRGFAFLCEVEDVEFGYSKVFDLYFFHDEEGIRLYLPKDVTVEEGVVVRSVP
jgi:hypothetical protein